MQDAFFKDQERMGAPQGAPIILNLQKFFTDCFQNLAQRFIGIQKYINDIVLKKKGPGAPLGAPLNLKIPKVPYRLLLDFGKNFHSNTEVFL